MKVEMNTNLSNKKRKAKLGYIANCPAFPEVSKVRFGNEALYRRVSIY